MRPAGVPGWQSGLACGSLLDEVLGECLYGLAAHGHLDRRYLARWLRKGDEAFCRVRQLAAADKGWFLHLK